MRIGWRLGVTLLLFAAGAAVLHMTPAVSSAMNPVVLYAFPTTLGAWSGVDGVPEEILPADPNEKLSVRRTYRDGQHVAWVSVALFVGQDDDALRASVNKFYPQRAVSLIEPVSLNVPLSGSSASPSTLAAVIIHQDSRRLLVAHWHQIGNQVYGNEYRFRFALMRDAIFARRADALLVRIALPLGPDGPVREGLDTVGSLAPTLYAALAPGARQ